MVFLFTIWNENTYSLKLKDQMLLFSNFILIYLDGRLPLSYVTEAFNLNFIQLFAKSNLLGRFFPDC